MNLIQKAAAFEFMMETPGWNVLKEYLEKNSTPVLINVDGIDSLIKQAYRNGISQGHKDVLDFVRITIQNAKRNNPLPESELPYPLNLVKRKNDLEYET